MRNNQTANSTPRHSNHDGAVGRVAIDVRLPADETGIDARDPDSMLIEIEPPGSGDQRRHIVAQHDVVALEENGSVHVGVGRAIQRDVQFDLQAARSGRLCGFEEPADHLRNRAGVHVADQIRQLTAALSRDGQVRILRPELRNAARHIDQLYPVHRGAARQDLDLVALDVQIGFNASHQRPGPSADMVRRRRRIVERGAGDMQRGLELAAAARDERESIQPAAQLQDAGR